MELKKKNVLVTGSSGFVGRHLVKKLKEMGGSVTCFDIANGRDVTKWSDIRNVKNTDIVFHLAAATFVPLSQKDPRRIYEANVIGTLNALEICRLKGSKMIFASSYVYGNPEYIPIDEKHPVKPMNPYARSKVLGEILCRNYYEDFGVRCIILRPFNIYGKGQRDFFLIPEIIKQLNTKTQLTLKDLTPRRDLVHVNDVVNAYIRAAVHDKQSFNIFNIGYGKSYSVLEVAEKLVELSGRRVQIKSLGEKRRGEVADTIADIRKAKNLLKWRPTVDIDEGLESLIIDR